MKYPRNHTYLSLEEAIQGCRSSLGSVKARGSVKDLSQESKDFLADLVLFPKKDSAVLVYQGSKNTMEIMIPSDTGAQTVLAVTGVNSRIKLVNKLKRI